MLQTRLALISAGLTAVGLLLGLVLVYLMLERRSLAETDQILAAQAHTVLLAAQKDSRHQIPPEIEDELTEESGVSSTLIYADGQLAFAGGVLDVPQPLDAAGLSKGHGVASVGAWRVYTLSHSPLVVQVARPLAPLRHTLERYVKVALPLTVTLGLLAGFTAWTLVGLALRRLEQLTEATRRFEAGSVLPEAIGGDEVATLTRSFSDLLGRLREQRLREQRFLAYAAHELRTPIAAFRANLEAAQFKGGLDAPGLERMHREALRLETLAQNLLALSRAEAGDARSESIDLADLVAEAFDRFQPLALEHGVELELEAHPAPVHADPRLVEQALNNLIINAIRYGSSEGGSIQLYSGISASKSWLEVSDSGPGLAQNLQEGLGLRVAKAVASASGGHFQIQSQAGVKARLEFPAVS